MGKIKRLNKTGPCEVLEEAYESDLFSVQYVKYKKNEVPATLITIYPFVFMCSIPSVICLENWHNFENDLEVIGQLRMDEWSLLISKIGQDQFLAGQLSKIDEVKKVLEL